VSTVIPQDERAATLRRSRARAHEQYEGQRVLGRQQPPFKLPEQAKNTARLAVEKSKITNEVKRRVVEMLEMSTSTRTPWWRTADAAQRLATYLKDAERDFRELVDELEVPES
jgi:DNA replication initiation complex subunit (GINS family)